MPEKHQTILVVEDDPSLCEAIADTLELAEYPVFTASGGEEALAILARENISIVISDVRMMPMDGIALLKAIRKQHPQLPVVLMTAYADVDRAVEAMRSGACDFLLKPFEPGALIAQIDKYALPAPGEITGVVAHDPISVNLFGIAGRVAQTDATVFLTGESGTGKEVVARFIHRHSNRRDGPFVAINCAAIPESLLEATLFGYEKGAFTAAQTAQAGKFEQAEGGTLLLDEVTEMTLALQAKLLRVLQEREVERVGGKKPIPLNIRIIATSNRDMMEAVRRGIFREDLYYRLNVFPILIPALRQRPLDIVALARHFLIEHGRLVGRSGLAFTPEAEALLIVHSWPGNVRELENIIMSAIALAGVEHVLSESALDVPVKAFAADELKGPADGVTLDAYLEAVERNIIAKTLAESGGNVSKTAQKLGIQRQTLQYKLRKYR